MDSQKIKAALPMAKLLEHYKARKVAVNNYWCPIHEQTGKHKTPSLVLHPKSQTVTCKSQNCFEGDSVFGVIAKIEKLDIKKDYPAILKIGAGVAGISTEEISAGSKTTTGKKYRVLSPEHKTYLYKRGLIDSTIKLMDLGTLYDKIIFLYRKEGKIVGYKAKTILPKTQWEAAAKKNPKWISYFIKGSKPAWWTVGGLKDKKIVYLVAGEYDSAVLYQELQKKGLDSEIGVFTLVTGEASGFTPGAVKELTALHKGEWRIVYDDDETGRKGAPARAEELSSTSKKVSTFVWTKDFNPQEKNGYDINDYFLRTDNVDIFLDPSNFKEYLGGGGPFEFTGKTPSDNGDVYAYKVGDYTWEFSNGILTIKNGGTLIYQKRAGNGSFMTDKTQGAMAEDLRTLKLFDDKKEAKKIILLLASHLLNERSKEAEEAKENIPLLEREVTLEEIHRAIAKIGVTTRELVEIEMATVISCVLGFSVPLWLLVIGNPSSLKTEVLKLLRGIAEVFYLSTMSENAFASGYIPMDGSEPNDLLSRLDERALLIRDLTTLFSLNEETVKKILGDLTSIFDGEYEKFTATRGLVKYKARFPLIACITPAILSKHHNYVHQLGARFLAYRIPNLSDADSERGYEIAWSGDERPKSIQEATILISSYCRQIIESSKDKPLPVIEDKNVREWFNDAAEFVRRVRGIAITKPAKFTNKNGEEVTYYEISDLQIEEPWRALNQLRNQAIALAVLRKKNTVTMEECKTLEPLVRSAAQVDRVEVLNALIDTAGITRKEIAEHIGKSTKTAGRQLKELGMLGLVIGYKAPDMADNAPMLWAIDPRFTKLLNAAEAPDGMDTNSEEGEDFDF